MRYFDTDKPPSKKVLIWDLSQLEAEKSNMGDKAIFSSTVSKLRNLAPHIEIITISSVPKYTERQYGVKAFHSWNICDIWRALSSSDLIIFGGGDLIQGRLLSLLYGVGMGILATMLNKPFICYAIGTSNYEEFSVVSKFLVFLLLNRAKLITVRDEKSKEVLKRLGVRRAIHFTLDVALNLAPLPRSRINETLILNIKENSPVIGVSPRRMLYVSLPIIPLSIQFRLKIIPKIYYEWNRKLAATLAKVLDHLINKLNAHVVFLPMYSGRFSRDDYSFAFEILQKMSQSSRARIINTEDYSPEELQSIFREMDVLIGMALHPLILSASMGTPIIAIGDSPKIIRFLQIIGQEKQFIHFENASYENLVQLVKDTWNRRNEIRLTLKKEIKRQRERMLQSDYLLMEVLADLGLKND